MEPYWFAIYINNNINIDKVILFVDKMSVKYWDLSKLLFKSSDNLS